MRFVPVRIPETGARWDAPESALTAHPGLIPVDQPEVTRARKPKPKKPIAPAPAAVTETKE